MRTTLWSVDCEVNIIIIVLCVWVCVALIWSRFAVGSAAGWFISRQIDFFFSVKPKNDRCRHLLPCCWRLLCPWGLSAPPLKFVTVFSLYIVTFFNSVHVFRSYSSTDNVFNNLLSTLFTSIAADMPGCFEDLKQKLVAQKLYYYDTHILANSRKSIHLNNQTMSKCGGKL